MPKLRNGKTDVEMFAQWLGRKCRNHHPLQEIGLSAPDRAATPRMYSSKTKGDLGITMLAPDRGVLVYGAHGRIFKITVEEVSDGAVADLELEKVGY